MNKKYLLQDLTDLLAEQGKLKKKDAEEFLKAFFTVIEESLFEGEVVKIPGLGTFKLLQVESRKSVNVTTGKEIEIKEHYKVSFTPDAALKDLVNGPFAHLEPIELDGKTEEIMDDEPEEVYLENRPYTPREPISRPVSSRDKAETRTDFDRENERFQPKTASKHEHMVERPKVAEPARDKYRNEFKRPAPEAKRPSDKKSQNQPLQTQGKPFWLILTVIVASLAIWAIYSNRTAMKDKENKLNQMLIDTTEYEETKPEELVPEIKDSMKVEQEINDKIDSMAVAEKTTRPKDKNIEKKLKEDLKTVAAASSAMQAKEPAKPKTSGNTFPIYTTLQKGDRLTLMSLRYYGHKVFWVYIYLANKNVIADPNNVPVGTKLRIPKPDPSRINPNDPDCIARAKALQTKILTM